MQSAWRLVSSTHDLRIISSADKVDHWIVFNIGGNKYRLITSMRFDRNKVYIQHVSSSHNQFNSLHPLN